MTYEINIEDYFGKSNQIILDLLQRDRSRLESLLKTTVEKVAQDYVMGVALAIKRIDKAEAAHSVIQLKISTPD